MIYQAQFKKEQQEFVARKLDAVGWIKYLSISVLWWLTFGFIYQSVGANRPFRDSITDATNGVGQLLMTAVYREQWIFWAATNIFSIYLWWGESLQIQGKYFIYLINSLVGWYQWSKAQRKLNTYVYQLIRGSSRVLFVCFYSEAKVLLFFLFVLYLFLCWIQVI